MKKILVVEDDLALRGILRDELGRHQYQVLEADNGQSGLAMAKLETPDLIILDLSMPFMDGMTMLDELRKDDAGKNMNVIVLTNLEANGTIAQKVIENKPLFYFIKSNIKLVDLVEKIDSVF